MAAIDRFPPRQRVRRRRAVRRRAASGSSRSPATAARPGLVLQHRLATCRRRTSPAASARSSPSCRSSCSATPRTWCRSCSWSSAGTTSGAASLDAAYTKLHRRGAALRLRVVVPVARLRHARRRPARRSAPAATSATGSRRCLAEYLNRTGSIILILTLLFLAIILSTQFSFGRLFAALGQMLRDRWAAILGAHRARREETAAREAAPGGAEEASRQGTRAGQGGPEDRGQTEDRSARDTPRAGTDAAAGRGRAAADEPNPEAVARKTRTAAMVEAAAAALKAASAKPAPTPATIKRPAPPGRSRRCRCPIPRGRRPSGRRARITLPPLALLDAPRARSGRSTSAS